jgi:hypothetical protein
MRKWSLLEFTWSGSKAARLFICISQGGSGCSPTVILATHFIVFNSDFVTLQIFWHSNKRATFVDPDYARRIHDFTMRSTRTMAYYLQDRLLKFSICWSQCWLPWNTVIARMNIVDLLVLTFLRFWRWCNYSNKWYTWTS